MAKQFANSGDPDQTLRSAASDLGLHCLPNTVLQVSRLQWVIIHTCNSLKFCNYLKDIKRLVYIRTPMAKLTDNYNRQMGLSIA